MGLLSCERSRSFSALGKSGKKNKTTPLLADNRKARHEYTILEDFEAGLSLVGSEVKAIRDGNISLKEAFCQFKGNELFLLQAHVADFPQAHARNHPSLRERKILLHRKELDKLQDAVKMQGVTIVPLSVYVKGRVIKLKIGLGKGKQLHDKRASIKAREQNIEMHRAIRDRE